MSFSRALRHLGGEDGASAAAAPGNDTSISHVESAQGEQVQNTRMPESIKRGSYWGTFPVLGKSALRSAIARDEVRSEEASTSARSRGDGLILIWLLCFIG